MAIPENHLSNQAHVNGAQTKMKWIYLTSMQLPAGERLSSPLLPPPHACSRSSHGGITAGSSFLLPRDCGNGLEVKHQAGKHTQKEGNPFTLLQ